MSVALYTLGISLYARVSRLHCWSAPKLPRDMLGLWLYSHTIVRSAPRFAAALVLLRARLSTELSRAVMLAIRPLVCEWEHII